MRRVAIAGGLLTIVAAGALGMVAVPPASAGNSHALIQGSGSSWSANAINQWIADVQPQGLQVVYTAVGSAQGRKDFAYKTTDFAVSDIGYQGQDPVSGDNDTSQGREFAYIPLVAGGTAFPYHIEVGGHLVRNLRLSGTTIAKIFTNQIANWNDPAITKDNNGRALPSIPIIPVVHSEGAGSTAQFTTYLNTVYPSIWQPFFGHDTFTEYYPRKGQAIAQNGSDGVMNFVASSAANGAIGYDEYSYALSKNYPVAKVLNKAGYYTLPTQYNDAVALTKAIINTDKSSPNYLLQDLHNVYSYGDVRTYPLSSYSYGIIPTASDDSKMTTAKRQTLVDWLSYSLCTGQREMGPIGYSPLPLNLVKAAFGQVGRLKQADSNVNLAKVDPTKCHNPTFDPNNLSRNYLAEVAPKPAACDRVGAGPCAASNDTRLVQNPGSNGQAPAPTNTGSTPSRSGGTGGGSAAGGGSAGTTGGGSPPSGGAAIDPVTGQVVGTTAGDGAVEVAAVPTTLSRDQGVSNAVLAPIAVLLLIGIMVGPPLIARRSGGGGA